MAERFGSNKRPARGIGNIDDAMMWGVLSDKQFQADGGINLVDNKRGEDDDDDDNRRKRYKKIKFGYSEDDSVLYAGTWQATPVLRGHRTSRVT